jgi:predicted transcriptional regulator
MNTKKIISKVKEVENLTVSQMADIFGVSRVQMHKYLNGISEMSLSKFFSGIEAMGYTVRITKQEIVLDGV